MTLFAGALIISVSLGAADSMILRPQWPVGKKINHHIDRVINWHMTGPMMPETKVVIKLSQDILLSVVGKSSQGGWIIEYQALNVKIDTTGSVNGSFDSKNPSSSDAGNKFAPARAMTKGKIRYHLDAYNKIFKTEGLDEQYAAVKAKMVSSGGSGGMQDQEQQFINGIFTEGFIKNSFEVFLVKGLSDKAVKPGKSWKSERQEKDPAVGSLNYKTKLTLKEWQTHGNMTYAFINVEGTVGSPEGISNIGPSGLPTSVKGGTLASNVLFDPTLGIIVTQRGYTEMPIFLDLSAVMGGATGEAATIKIQVKNEVTTTMQKIE